MTEFHNSASKELEINLFLNAFTLLDKEQQLAIRSYVEGENKSKCQEVHVCQSRAFMERIRMSQRR